MATSSHETTYPIGDFRKFLPLLSTKKKLVEWVKLGAAEWLTGERLKRRGKAAVVRLVLPSWHARMLADQSAIQTALSDMCNISSTIGRRWLLLATRGETATEIKDVESRWLMTCLWPLTGQHQVTPPRECLTRSIGTTVKQNLSIIRYKICSCHGLLRTTR